MQKQTSVDWLQRKIKETYMKEGKLPLAYTLDLVRQAKEKNKDEIMEAYDKGNEVDDDLQRLYGTPEEYYNKTFGQGSPDTSSPNIKNK
jgi:flagellar biosynthesis chaperone FliJ